MRLCYRGRRSRLTVLGIIGSLSFLGEREGYIAFTNIELHIKILNMPHENIPEHENEWSSAGATETDPQWRKRSLAELENMPDSGKVQARVYSFFHGDVDDDPPEVLQDMTVAELKKMLKEEVQHDEWYEQDPRGVAEELKSKTTKHVGTWRVIQ